VSRRSARHGISWIIPKNAVMKYIDRLLTNSIVVLGGVKVIALSIGPKVRGFTSGRECWIFKGDKNL
jgi:hypothetical protein